MGQKVESLDMLWFQVCRAFLSTFQNYDELRHFAKVPLSIIFHVTVKYFFQGSFCAFSNCNLSLTHRKVNSYSIRYAKIFKLSSKNCSLVDPHFLGRLFFVIIVRNAETVSFKSFVFILLASMVLSNRSRRTCR